MVVKFTVAGRQVGSHVLAMITLGSAAAIGFLATGGKKAEKGPPIQASSSEEEKFIREFIQKAEEEAKAAAKH